MLEGVLSEFYKKSIVDIQRNTWFQLQVLKGKSLLYHAFVFLCSFALISNNNAVKQIPQNVNTVLSANFNIISKDEQQN